MIKRFYFMKITTELTSGEKVYNDVMRTHTSFFRDDHAAYVEMTEEVCKMWDGYVGSMHVTEFKKL